MKVEGADVVWRKGDSITLDGKVQSSSLQDLYCYRSRNIMQNQRYPFSAGHIPYRAVLVNEAKQNVLGRQTI